MPLPPEIQERIRRRETPAPIVMKTSQGEPVVLEGKTNVPFGSFVKLILQRKVQLLFKDWQNEPIIFSSDLLTQIASSPEDHPRGTSKVILTGMVVGLCAGIFLSALALLAFSLLGIAIGTKELFIVLCVLIVPAIAVLASTRIQAGKHAAKLVEQMEKVADVFSK